MNPALPQILFLIVSIVAGPNHGDAQICNGTTCGQSVTVAMPPPANTTALHFKAGKVPGKYKYTLIYVDATKSRATYVDTFYVHKDGTIGPNK